MILISRKMIFYYLEEDSGLPERVINKSHALISIFMPNLQSEKNNKSGVRSLNLSVACGIAIYEANKTNKFLKYY